jgi:hypothetical protein
MNQVAKIRGSFEEIIGTLSSIPIENLVMESVKNAIIEGARESTMNLDSQMQISLNADALAEVFTPK